MDAERIGSYKWLVLAVVVAALLQGILVARSPTISADGIRFVAIARGLSVDPIQTFRQNDQHPGFSAMMLGCARVMQTLGIRQEPMVWAWGGQIVAFVCGLLSVVIVWFFARDLFDVEIANLAALIWAVLPIPRIIAADALSDTPHLMFYVLAAWLATSGVTEGRTWRLAGAGAASGLAYWIRPEGLEVFLVALACLMLHSMSARWPLRRAALACGALSLGALIVAAPYPILAAKITSKQLPFAKARPVPTFISDQARQEAITETITPSQPPSPAPVVAAAQRAPEPTAVEAKPVAVEPAAAESVAVAPTQAASTSPAAPADASAPPTTNHQRPTTFSLALRLVGRGFVRFLVSVSQGFKFVFVPLYLISFVPLVRRNPGGWRVALVALLATTHLLILLAVYVLSGYIAHRHVLPMVVLAMPFTALGLAYVAELVSRALASVHAFKLNVAPQTMALVVFVGCAAVILPYSMRAYNREFAPVIAATEWVSEHATAGTGIVSNSPYVGFYGELPVTMLDLEAPTLDAALTKAVASARYEYVILHVGAHAYQPRWLGEIEAHYRQVQVFPDVTNRHKQVLVLEAKDAQARRLIGGSRS